MKKSAHTRVLPLSLAALVLAGCATNRPPRFGSRPAPSTSTTPTQPTTARGPVMPPSFQDPSLQEEEIVGVQLTTPVTSPAPQPQVTTPRVRTQKVQPKSGTPYTLKKGESLSAVAARHRMGWKQLADYNLIQDPNRVYAGQVILIPPGRSASGGSSRTTTRPRPAPPEVVVAGEGTYVVQSGDSLSVIAQRYGTTVKKLKAANSLVSDRLLVGQILKLPQGAELNNVTNVVEDRTPTPPSAQPTPVATRPIPPPPAATPVPVDVVPDNGGAGEGGEPLTNVDIIDKPYPIIVQEGDTLQSIAENYIVTEAKIRELNNLKEGEEVTPGQKLMMPATIY